MKFSASIFAAMTLAFSVSARADVPTGSQLEVEAPQATADGGAKVFTDADIKAIANGFDMACNNFDNKGIEYTIEPVTIEYKESYDTAADPIRKVNFYIVSCGAGAYNVGSILLKFDRFTNYEAGGSLVPLSFATAVTNRKGQILGMRASVTTNGLSFDPKTKLFSTFAKGGQEYEVSQYAYFSGEVILRRTERGTVTETGEKTTVVYSKTLPLAY